MLMNKILDFMGKDHDRLDGIFKEFQNIKNKDYSKAKNLYHDFKTGLQRHIVWEEEILFPLFEERTGMRDSGPTAVMKLEHKQIKEFLDLIHERVVKKDMQVNDLEVGLLTVLGEHNNKEESVLYPWIDNTLSKEEIEAAFEKIRNLPQEKYNNCCK